MLRIRYLAAAMIPALLMLPAREPAWAGPPYLTDDPEPTDTGHWEIYGFSTGGGAPDGLVGEAGLDVNYGLAPDFQVNVVLPAAFSDARGFTPAGLQIGPGDIQMAAKYRLLDQDTASWRPDVAIYPRLFLPTAGRAFGTGRVGVFLPVWAQKDFDPWSVFGGGGFQLNPGPGQRNFWQGGMAVTYSLGPDLSIGAELYGQTRDSRSGGALRAMDLGAAWQFVEHWSLIASAGPAWSEDAATGYVFYLALEAQY